MCKPYGWVLYLQSGRDLCAQGGFGLCTPCGRKLLTRCCGTVPTRRSILFQTDERGICLTVFPSSSGDWAHLAGGRVVRFPSMWKGTVPTVWAVNLTTRGQYLCPLRTGNVAMRLTFKVPTDCARTIPTGWLVTAPIGWAMTVLTGAAVKVVTGE